MARVNEKMEIGLVGLAVMGQNLVLNLVDHGYRVAVHNRTTATTHRFLAERAAGLAVTGADTLEGLVEMLEPPRRILLMVKAGAPVDSFIGRLLPLLSPGDVLADLGNSFYLDTARRLSKTKAQGIHYLGVGVSGGEEGARRGPSIMAGGGLQAWDLLRDPSDRHLRQAPRRDPLLRPAGSRGCGPLREDGPQRHRIRRHAASGRGLPPAQVQRDDPRGDERIIPRVAEGAP